MPFGHRLSDAIASAGTTRASLGAEIREARRQAGLSQSSAARAVGMSHAQFGRIERAELADLSVEQVCRACAAVGLKLVARAYPDGDPVRDAPHLALLSRFRGELPNGVGWATEVAVRLHGDRRAWDAVAGFPEGRLHVEAETRLRDVQALLRKIALKQRDDGAAVVLLLLNDTPWNRSAVRAHPDALATAFPTEPRVVLRAIRVGRRPRANGLLFL